MKNQLSQPLQVQEEVPNLKPIMETMRGITTSLSLTINLNAVAACLRGNTITLTSTQCLIKTQTLRQGLSVAILT